MISRLRGAPVGRTPDGLVVDVGGVGYLVYATASVFRRADGASERSLFVQLLGVSGIGPKVALAVVSSASPDELQRAIALRDSARFQAIPGIGKKTAERIVLELEGSLAEAAPPADS
jgi:holliday junction DNA helicase RuvA